VPNVVDTFYICQLDHTGGLQITDFEVTQELLNHGVQFCMLLPVKPWHVPLPLQSLFLFVSLATNSHEMTTMPTSNNVLPSSVTLV